MAALLMNPPERVVNDGASEADEALVEAFVVDAADALRRSYERYGSLVFTYCRRTLSPEAAADATQETFVAAWRSWERFDPARGSLAAWLLGIARFKVVEQLRRDGRAPQPASDEELRSALAEVPTQADAVADRLLVADALDQLSPRVRTAVELAVGEGLTHAEVAERTGAPLGTVKSDVRRGLDRLRRHLTQGSEVFHG